MLYIPVPTSFYIFAKRRIMKVINVQKNQGIPKYKQIIHSIEKTIERIYKVQTNKFNLILIRINDSVIFYFNLNLTRQQKQIYLISYQSKLIKETSS